MPARRALEETHELTALTTTFVPATRDDSESIFAAGLHSTEPDLQGEPDGDEEDTGAQAAADEASALPPALPPSLPPPPPVEALVEAAVPGATPGGSPMPGGPAEAGAAPPRSAVGAVLLGASALFGVGAAVAGWSADPFAGWFYPDGFPEGITRSPTWAYAGFGLVWVLICWITASTRRQSAHFNVPSMREAAVEIGRDNWQWREQTWHLAVADLQKEAKGAALGYAWIIVRPAIFMGFLWFALAIGLRQARTTGDYPYILWLATGFIAWNFVSDMLGSGMNVYRRYTFLVNRVRFPLSVISTFYGLSSFLVYLVSMVIVVAIMLIARYPVTVYALQFPFLAVLMYFFMVAWSIMMAPLATLSKDFYVLVKSLTAPLFWVSGVFFAIDNIGSATIQTVLHFNPLAFFIAGFRAAICDHFWLWDRPGLLLPFIMVSALLVALMLRNYARLSREVADVL